MSIKNMPPDDRPREKILHKGVDSLSNAELLAVLLRTGSKGNSAINIARELVGTSEKLLALRGIHPSELALQKGIGPAKAVTIIAALELGRRLSVLAALERQCIGSTRDAVDLLMPQLQHESKESILLLLLNARAQVLCIEKVAQGSLLTSIAQPREVFQVAILNKAAALIIAHNHPSGDPEPSADDIAFTDRLAKAGVIMSIPLIDHIIIGDGKYFSFAEHGYIN